MEKYRLFGRRQTGSMAVEAALEEAKVDYDFIATPRPSTAEEIAAFARINPRLQVPVLVHPDGTVITEGPAILVHIADANSRSCLAPAPGSSARATLDRWLAFFHANVYEGMLREIFPDRYTNDPALAPATQAAATAYVRHHFLLLEGSLEDGPYLHGNLFTVFDIYLWMLCYWIDAAWLAANCPKIHRLWQTANARPVLASVAQRHFG
jgi:glutathione S-transferase